jgi:hypothetical protein
MEEQIGWACGTHRSKYKNEVLVMKPESKTPLKTEEYVGG